MGLGARGRAQGGAGIFDLLEKTSDDQGGRRTVLFTQMRRALSKHAPQEENAIYATLRDEGLTGAAAHLIHDHGDGKQHLFDLTEMLRTDPARLPKLK